jgi:hypothetical protein
MQSNRIFENGFRHVNANQSISSSYSPAGTSLTATLRPLQGGRSMLR